MSSDEMNSSDGVEFCLIPLPTKRVLKISFEFETELDPRSDRDLKAINEVLSCEFDASNISIEEVEYYKATDTK